MKHDLHLLVIDPQNDFCDVPPDYLARAGVQQGTAPALPVPGAHADMLTLSDLVLRGAAGLTGISATLDSHHRVDIAHPTFWVDEEERELAPFTEVAAADVRAGRVRPRAPGALPRVLDYLDALEAAGRYRHMVWPVHCEMGTWGQRTHAAVQAAFDSWERRGQGRVNTVTKGQNPWTEHYSAIQAEVPDRDDPSTHLNAELIRLLAASDKVFIAGEAGSHCVKATTEHLVANLPPEAVSRLVLVTDCMSAVAGFEEQHQRFLDDMVARGVQTATAAEVLPELLANARP